MPKIPNFKPQETTKANYDQDAINWSYVTLKYDTPFGPEVKKYDPYYSYNVDVNMNGQQVNHKWYPSVDEHKLIQLAGAIKDTVLATTYVKEEKRKGLVVMYSGGPQVARDPANIDAEIAAGLAKLAPQPVEGQGAQLPGVILPPAPPQIPPPPGAPTPPPPPQPQDDHTGPFAPPPPAVPEVPPPQPRQQAPPPRNSQPPPSKPFENGDGPYSPRIEDERVMEVLNAMADDSVAFRRMAWDRVEATFADVLPTPPEYAKPTKPQQMEIAQIQAKRADLILGLSAPINMTLEKQAYRVWKSGQSLAGEHEPESEPEPEPSTTEERVPAKTREEALAMISELHPDKFPEGHEKSTIIYWLKYTADPVEHIGAWVHAANICKVFGLDTDVLLDDFDVTVLMSYTQAIWDYADMRDDDQTRNEALEQIAEQYGVAPEQMQFEEEAEAK